MIGTYTILQSLHKVSSKHNLDVYITSQFNPYPKLGMKNKFSLSRNVAVYPTFFIKPKDSKNNLYIIYYIIGYINNCLTCIDGKEFKGGPITETYLCNYEAELTSDGFKLYVGKDKKVCINVKKSKHSSKYEVSSIEVNNVKFDKYLAYFSFLVSLEKFCYGFFGDDFTEKLEELNPNEVIKYIDERENIGKVSFKILKLVQCDDFITMILLYTGNKKYELEFSFSIYKNRYLIISGTYRIIVYDIEEDKFWDMVSVCDICFKTFDGVCVGPYKIKFDNGIEVEKKDTAYYYDIDGSYEALYKTTFYAPFGIPLNIAPVRFIGSRSRILRVLPFLNECVINTYYSRFIYTRNNELKEDVIYDYVPPLVTCVLKNE